METSLHRQLKLAYAGERGETEAARGEFRIDAIRGDELVEVQRSSLSSIRRKVAELLRRGHRLTVVKPIIARKRIEKREAAGGAVISTRWSPKRGRLVDLLDELVYFAKVFPHPLLSLEAAMVEIVETRLPPSHARRRRRRRVAFEVGDQELLSVSSTHRFRTASDLAQLLPPGLPPRFDTAALAEALAVSRSTARRIAYGLRGTGAITASGKRGNSILYVESKRCQRG